MVTPVIQVQDLSKSFGDNSVLRRVSMDVATGETVVIIGASGSGKTTFLRCLNRLEEPSAGTVRLDGNPVMNPYNSYRDDRSIGGAYLVEGGFDFIFKLPFNPFIQMSSVIIFPLKFNFFLIISCKICFEYVAHFLSKFL